MTTTDANTKRGGPLRLVAILILAIGMLVLGLAGGPKVRAWLASSEAASTTDSGTWYISQMHPWIIQPEPGQCPICGMDLTPVDPARFAGEITIDPVIVQNIGVRIAMADRGPIVEALRSAGTVTVAEDRLFDVVPRFGGWVEDVFVDARFDRVEAGDPLFRVTSPEVLIAARDFALVRDGAGADDPALLAAARARLELLGIPAREVERLAAGGEPSDSLAVRAPANGVVWRREVRAGTTLAPRAIAMQIADLSTVWIETQVHERDLGRVVEGGAAEIEIDALPGVTLAATIDRVLPEIDARTRSTRARLVVDNRDGVLRPGMFATVTIPRASDETFVRVPREAVIGTGARKVLFVSLGRGRFEPRDVTPGSIDREGRLAILAGVEEGEPVVVSGQFLLDSESRMREALAKVMRGDLAGDVAPAAPASARAVVTLDDATRNALATALDDYLALQDDLYRNDLEAARPAADRGRASLDAFLSTANAADEHFAHRVAGVAELRTTAAALDGDTLDALRVAFGEVSVALREVLLAVGAPENAGGPWVGMRCGMAEGIRDDGVWLQVGTDARNPYFGDASGMRSCAVDTWGVPPIGGAGEDHSGHDHAGHDHADHASHESGSAEPPPTDAPLESIDATTLAALIDLGDELHRDDLAAARRSAVAALPHVEGHDHGAASLVPLLRSIADATELQAARVPFGRIGLLLRDAARAGKLPSDADLSIHHCGMAPGIIEDGVWLQRGPIPKNPYFGHEHGMAECAIDSWRVTDAGLVEVDE